MTDDLISLGNIDSHSAKLSLEIKRVKNELSERYTVSIQMVGRRTGEIIVDQIFSFTEEENRVYTDEYLLKRFRDSINGALSFLGYDH